MSARLSVACARVNARGSIAKRFARSAELCAGAVRTVASVAQIATGPALGVAIAAVSEAAIAAIASYAAVDSLGDAHSARRSHALAYVIARLEDEELCDPLLADAWRFAVGARDPVLRVDSATTAVRAAAGVAVRRAVRKNALGKVLKLTVVADLARAPQRAREAHRLVARARHHARAFAEANAAPGDTPL
jgi:hypothetical protein